jgi:hypothetical protein
VIGLIRNQDHADEVRRAEAVPSRCDLEPASVEEIAEAIKGAGAIVFAAGAGPGYRAVYLRAKGRGSRRLADQRP